MGTARKSKKYLDMTKDERITAEVKKLNAAYSKLEPKAKRAVSSLIEEAAFMSASLYDLRQLVNKNGHKEQYQNGANQYGWKISVDFDAYKKLIDSYAKIIKQLTDLLPKEEPKTEITQGDGFDDFVSGRDD